MMRAAPGVRERRDPSSSVLRARCGGEAASPVGVERDEVVRGAAWRRRSSLPAHDNERPRPCKRRGRHQARCGSLAGSSEPDRTARRRSRPAVPPGARSARPPPRRPPTSRERPGEAEHRPGSVSVSTRRACDGRRSRAPARSTTSSRKAARGRRDSTRITWSSGRAMATGDPGESRPGPQVAPPSRRRLGDDGRRAEAVQDVSLPDPCQVSRGDHPQGERLVRGADPRTRSS